MTPIELRGRITVDWDVAAVLLDIEARGGRFAVTAGQIRVSPSGTLTANDRAYLVAHKPEVLRLLEYVAYYD